MKNDHSDSALSGAASTPALDWRSFAAGFTAAREQESLISEDGPWYPKWRTAADAYAAVRQSPPVPVEDNDHGGTRLTAGDGVSGLVPAPIKD